MSRKCILALIILLIASLAIVALLFKSRLAEPKSETEKLMKVHYKGVDCAQLSGDMIRPGGDIAQSKKQVCAAERAWFENNPTFCRLHSSPDHCFTWMAIKLKDDSLCHEPGVRANDCAKVVNETKNEDTWHWKDYIKKNRNPI